MPPLILARDTLSVKLRSKRLEIRRAEPPDGNAVTHVHVRDIDRVVVSGKPAISTPVITTLMDAGIPCFFVTARGRWRGAITPDNSLNAARRIRQYERVLTPGFSLRVSRKLVYAKLRNSRRVLQRLAANRESAQTDARQAICSALQNLAAEALVAPDLDVLRGLEGRGASLYFNLLGTYFPATMPFAGRNRRPPRDPANALLSWTYAILLGEVEAAIRAHGLDAAIGNLHSDTLRSPSLALDLMEPLRAPLADLLVLDLVNHRRIRAEDHFEHSATDGAILLNEDGRRRFFEPYEEALTRRFVATKGTPPVTFRHVIDEQVCVYLKWLERGQDADFFLLP